MCMCITLISLIVTGNLFFYKQLVLCSISSQAFINAYKHLQTDKYQFSKGLSNATNLLCDRVRKL